jgi:hypothetical protein
MVCFQTKNPNLGKFWRVLVYCMTIWSILRPLEIFHGHSVYFVVIWYIFPRFGILDQEKTGNHGLRSNLIINFSNIGAGFDREYTKNMVPIFCSIGPLNIKSTLDCSAHVENLKLLIQFRCRGNQSGADVIITNFSKFYPFLLHMTITPEIKFTCESYFKSLAP